MAMGRRSYLAGVGAGLGVGLGAGLSGVLLAACGAGGETSGAAKTSSGPATVQYLVQSDSLWEKDKLMLEPFKQKAPNVTVEAIPVPSDSFTKLKVLMAGGTPPDSGYMNVINMPESADAGMLAEVDKLLQRDWKSFDGDDVYPGGWEAVTWKGKRYGTVFEANPFLPVFRPDFFDSSAATYPTKLADQGKWDWNSVIETSKQLTKRGADGKATQYGIQLRTDSYSLFHWVWNNGGEVWNQDRTACLLNQPAAVEAVQFMQDFFVKHRTAPQGTELRDLTGKTDNDMRTGAVGFEWQYSGGGSRMGGVVNFPFMVAPEPKGKVAKIIPHMNGGGVVLFKGAKQPDAAWEWVKFVGGKEADQILMQTGRTPPRRKSGEAYYAKEVKYPPNTKVLTDVARSARMTPVVVPYLDFHNAITKELAPVWLGQRTPKDALDEIVRQVNPLLKPK
jgi:multiple sugar transport system substrate-binding protein